MLLPLIGLVPPTGWSSIYPIQKLCTHPHVWQRSLSCGALIVANSGEDKVYWEPRPTSKHQVVWTMVTVDQVAL